MDADQIFVIILIAACAACVAWISISSRRDEARRLDQPPGRGEPASDDRPQRHA